jgi:uncharacterized protein
VAEVSVLGHGSASGTPDEALVSAQLTALRPTPEDAYADVAERSTVLTELLDELGVPAEARTTAGVTLREERDYVSGEYVHRGYRATNSLALRLTDQAVLARLLREAVSRADARIDGPAWRMASDNPARLEACRRAAVVAREKCETYAQALDMRLGALLLVAEPGLGPPLPRPEMLSRSMVAYDAEAAPEIDVGSGELEVQASIEVTYALEPR